MSQRQEFSSRRSISCSTSWFDHLLVHLLAFFDFLPKRLMFPQIIRSTQLDTPCCRRFHEANIVGVPCKRVQHCCATLHRSQNNRNVGTCWAKSLTGFKLYATSANKYQHWCGSMQTDATSHSIVGPNNVGCCWPTMLRPFAWASLLWFHANGPNVNDVMKDLRG